MERNKLLRANYLDILFDGRNKKYGGYELRSRYAGRARRATLVVTLGVALVSAAPFIADALSTKTPTAPPPIVFVQPTILDVPKPEEHPPLPNVAPPPPATTIADPVLRIVHDEEADTPSPTIDEVQDAQIALNTTEGGPGDANLIPTEPVGNGPAVVELPKPKEVIYTFVEQQPQFPGDLQAFLQSALRYPEAAKEAGEEGRVGVQFVVNEDGSISSAEVLKSATPQLDAEALRVVRSMPRWKPGKQNGKEVKVYFSLPVTFKLD